MGIFRSNFNKLHCSANKRLVSKCKGLLLLLIIVLSVLFFKHCVEKLSSNQKLMQGVDVNRILLQHDARSRFLAVAQPTHHSPDQPQTEDNICHIEKIIFPIRSVVIQSAPEYKMLLHGDKSDQFISDSLFKGQGYSYFEKDQQKMMEQVLPTDVPPKQVVILDIGANIGLHSLYFASKGYEVHAFEPFPTNYHLLQCSKVANDFQNLITNNFGLSDHPHKTCMKVVPTNQGAAQIKLDDTCNESDQIQLEQLDEYMESKLGDKHPYLIKIDVEGHEVAAWLGGLKLLSERPPKYIFSEVSPEEIHKFGATVVQYFELMAKFGYSIYYIHVHQWITGPPFSEQLENMHLFDVMMVHNSVKQK